MTRRGATDLVGILPIDKPSGMTSHDVVARVRRATGEGRVGHAGTLDPMATGLLVVLVGSYTRLAPYLTCATKSYDATITFGSETDTDDADGDVVRRAPVPAETFDPEYARRVLGGFVGRSMQAPPSYSAIKLGGETAHRAARAGRPLDLPAREIEVTEARLVQVEPANEAWRVAFTVSKGTYVRALARDAGRACGTAAHLTALRRTASGTLTLAETHSLDDVCDAAASGRLEMMFADPLEAMGLPVVTAPDSSVLLGSSLPLPTGRDLEVGTLTAVTLDGRLAAIYRVAHTRLEPVAVLTGGGAA